MSKNDLKFVIQISYASSNKSPDKDLNNPILTDLTYPNLIKPKKTLPNLISKSSMRTWGTKASYVFGTISNYCSLY
jgi:hypothetical protein